MSDLVSHIEGQIAIAKSLGKEPSTLFITRGDWDTIVAQTAFATEDAEDFRTEYRGMGVLFIQEGIPFLGI